MSTIEESDRPSIAWHMEHEHEILANGFGRKPRFEYSNNGDRVTYKGSLDWFPVHSNRSFSSGAYYIEISVHALGDETNIGVTNDIADCKKRAIDHDNNWYHNPPGTMYYCGRRHKTGDLADGCASLKVDGQAQRRMYHVADGARVGVLLNFKTEAVDFFINDMWQGMGPIPKGEVWVVAFPDDVDDCFEIAQKPVPRTPSRLEFGRSWVYASLFSESMKPGDIIKFGDRFATIHYGPDLQGDFQLIYNDFYPEFFPVSGDLNVNDPRLTAKRWYTSLALVSALCTCIASFACAYVAGQMAMKTTIPLEEHVLFKTCIVFFIGTFSTALVLMLNMSSDAIWKKRFFRSLQTLPVSFTVIAMLCWGAEDINLKCPSDKWGPMIPLVAQLYVPDGLVRHDLKWLSDKAFFNPFMQPPAEVLPSMDHSIKPRKLTERTLYFSVEICLMVSLTCVVLEVFRLLSSNCPCRSSLGAYTRAASEDSASLIEHGEEPNPTDPSPGHPVNRWQRISYMAMFLLWYVAFQVLLHIEMDVMLMLGAINVVTGPAWEFWIPFIAFVCCTHLLTGILRYVLSAGTPQKSPALMVCMTLAPVIGNEVHIFKDHVETALCFAVAHCTEGDLHLVAMVLGSLSFCATFVPLAFLFADATARQGLLKAHWPLMEAFPPEPKIQKSKSRLATTFFQQMIDTYARDFIDLAIPAVTVEKQIRAFMGEFPDGVLDVAFIFFFGGSIFLMFSIAISIAKVIGIPVMREQILPGLIRRYGCSMASLEIYRRNTQHIYLFDDRFSIFWAIEKFEWHDLSQILSDAGFMDSSRSPHGRVAEIRVPNMHDITEAEGRLQELEKECPANASEMMAVAQKYMDALERQQATGTDESETLETLSHECDLMVENAETEDQREWLRGYWRTAVRIAKGRQRYAASKDGTLVRAALLDAAEVGSGKRLRERLESLGQSTDFVIVYEMKSGSVEGVKAAVKCGFDLRAMYHDEDYQGGRPATLEVLLAEFHGETDRHGNRHLTELGKDILAVMNEPKGE